MSTINGTRVVNGARAMIIHVYPGNNDTRVVIPLRHCILRALVYLERHACRSPLTRTTWMDVSPGIIHVEAGEALFSKLDRAVQRHPATVTHAQYTDVFLSLPAARNAEHRRTRAPAFVLQTFCDRMQHLLSTSLYLRLCAGLTRRTRIMSLWPPCRTFPQGPCDC